MAGVPGSKPAAPINLGFKRGSQNPRLLGGRFRGLRRLVVPGWKVSGAAALCAVGWVFLKGAERVVGDQYEDRRRLTDAQRKALDDALVVVSDMWTAMREEGADKLWEVHQNFRAKTGLGGTSRCTALCRIRETGTGIKVVNLEMRE